MCYESNHLVALRYYCIHIACMITKSSLKTLVSKLQQRMRIERVIGFVLAIWGILFYSRLLSTMTEQFRVSLL